MKRPTIERRPSSANAACSLAIGRVIMAESMPCETVCLGQTRSRVYVFFAFISLRSVAAEIPLACLHNR